MARAGTTPKDPEQRQRRNAPPEIEVLDPAGRVADAPALPDAGRYGARTLAWYDVWCRSAQAVRFTATDWQRLHMLAPLVDRYFAEPEQRLMAEIRLNEERLGATPIDRLRLRWRITDKQHVQDDEPEAPKRRRERRDLRIAS